MKKFYTKAIAIVIALLMMTAFSVTSFAYSTLISNTKAESTALSKTSGTAGIELTVDAGTVNEYVYNSFLKGRTSSSGRSNQFIKTARAFVFKGKTSEYYKMNEQSSSNSSEINAYASFCGYLDMPYLSHVQTEHHVENTSSSTDCWNEIITYQYFGSPTYSWAETTTHIDTSKF